jgi:hypothetical protein
MDRLQSLKALGVTADVDAVNELLKEEATFDPKTGKQVLRRQHSHATEIYNHDEIRTLVLGSEHAWMWRD